ncbi:hypothetical protein [Paraburkholderia sp. SIMBA_054]|uniref:hypothetical protein n=1 Tax=Paraburkholderia sp. SIMBA_054 TaxID=3085795 RepID=UPI00397B87F4
MLPFKGAAAQESAGLTESERRLAQRFGISKHELHDAIRPLFLLMHEHGITNIAIDRDGTKARIVVDDVSL